MDHSRTRARLADGSEIAVVCHGPAHAPPLCLVAGLGGAGAFWDPIVGDLSRRFRVIRHDHRGTGESSAPRIDYSIGQMTEDLVALLDDLEIERASVIGHSTGGAIAQTLALDHPGRVEVVVLSSSWAGPDPYLAALFQLRLDVLEQIGAAAYARLSALFLHSPGALSGDPSELWLSEAEAVEKLGDPEVVARRIRALMAHDRRADLGRLALPIRIVCAGDDRITPIHLSRELAARIPGAALEVLDHGGHFVPDVDPGAYLAALEPWLASVSR